MLFIRKFDPLIHHRRSLRLRGYDYSRAGRYFITICCQGHVCRFGAVENGKMILNDAGKMIEKWHLISEKFRNIELGAYIVMPNHFHAIIIITDPPIVWADLRVRPDNLHPEIVGPDIIHPAFQGGHDSNNSGGHDSNDSGGHVDSNGISGGHVGPPLQGPPQPDRPTIPRIVQWFKTMATNEYIRGVKNLGWERFDGKLWQRNYYEHIIRDEKSFIAISEYIKNNPAKWIDDKFYHQ
jgi:REP element-mobilizing transposase RayT